MYVCVVYKCTQNETVPGDIYTVSVQLQELEEDVKELEEGVYSLSLSAPSR